MPIYEYDCQQHGTFEVVTSLAQRMPAEPCPYPQCSQPARRVLSSPSTPQLCASDVIAHDRNERSRHEPRMVTRGEPPHAARNAEPPRPALQRAPGSRPWVVEHG